MPPSTFWQALCRRRSLFGHMNSQRIAKLLGVFLLFILIGVELGPMLGHSVFAQPFSHTSPTVDNTCRRITYSPDNNPFPLCPGPFPKGGNCVWWAWEEWHQLGYDLPRNWGNAADWVVDAERAGLPLGKTPRPGSIAVFPRADGVWAFTAVGHAAFVTQVSNDGNTFDVTYQNYGDPTPMRVGLGYDVSIINEPRFQNGSLRFIYFPRFIDPRRFARLPGVSGNVISGILHTNYMLTNDPTGSGSQIALGLPSTTDQEFNADFTGVGLSELVLYDRAQGSLSVLSLSDELLRLKKRHFSRSAYNDIASSSDAAQPQLVSLSDTSTPVNGWGSSLEIHVGDFTGTGLSDILLYDRVKGTLQLISLTAQLTINKHVILNGFGTGWEIYPGKFDGHRTTIFMYNRLINSAPITSTPETPTPGTTPTSGSSPTPGHTPGSTPRATPSPTPKSKPSPTPTPKATPTPSPTPTPKPKASPAARVKADPTPTASPTPTANASPAPQAKADPTPAASPTPTANASPAARAKVDPTPTASPTPVVCATVTSSATASASSTPSPTLTACPTSPTPKSCTAQGQSSPPNLCSTPTVGINPNTTVDSQSQFDPQGGGGGGGGGGTQGIGLDGGGGGGGGGGIGTGNNPGPLKANVLVLNFDQNFNILYRQQYTLADNAWEVYVGRFVNANQDGIFLYDRIRGEVRLLSFGFNLHVAHNQKIDKVDSNWEVHSGDFKGTGSAQVLLYDPSTGKAQILVLAPDLKVSSNKSYTGWKSNQVLYVGHFGSPALGIMLYDPEAEQSTFMAFDSSLAVVHTYTVKSWSQRYQILIGAFIDRSRCLAAHDCSTGDDILVLNRQTGQMEQYVFSFGNQFQVADNRSQSFLRNGTAAESRLTPVDTTTFSLLTTLNTSVRNEELY